MTDRMEPTMQLRWVRRSLWDGGDMRVLQQLWRTSEENGLGDDVIVAEEWRDVPVAEE